jgi:iron complex outermembrane recepter protein
MRSCSHPGSANASVLLISLLALAAATGCLVAPRAPAAEPDRHDQRSGRAEHEDADDERREHEEREAKGGREHDEPTLEEVIVTAQKREESLQKAPLAVTAVTGDELQHAGITDAQGLTDVVPGLEVGNFGSTTNFTIRGITTNTDPNLGDSPTAFHIDGVYQGRPAAASGLFYDVDRLEVLSGPQGTLYGKDSTGGTINLITRKPNFAATSAEFSQDVGSYYLYRTFGMVNVPVDDQFAFRVAFQTQHHTGYLKTGYDDADDLAGRVHLQWRPSESFSALFTQDYFHQGGVGNGEVPLPDLPGDNWQHHMWSVVLDPSQLGLVEAGFQGRTNNVSNQTSLQLEWDLGAARLSSVSAYHHLHLDSAAYLNGTPSLQQETDAEISQEIRLASADSSKAKWVVGAYYHREHQTNDLFFYNQAGPGVDSDQIFPKINTPSYALFGQMTYPILPRWRVTAGLRGSTDEKSIQGSINQVNYAVVSNNPLVVDRTTLIPVVCNPGSSPSLGYCPQASPNGSLTARRLTWRFGMDFDLTTASLLFFNASTGYKQGGLDAAQPPNNIYRPETITAYEIGSKNRFFDERLQVNLDAYWYQYKDYQVDQLEFFPGQTGLVFGDFISNAASARHKGLELQTRALLSRHDELSLNVAYLSAVFQQFQFPASANPGNPSSVITFEDLSGYSEFNAPRWTGTLSYQHTWELPNEAQLSTYVLSHAETFHWGSPDHQADSRQPSYTRTQFVLQYSSPDGKYIAQAYVRNIENRAVFNTYTFQGPPAPAGSQFPGSPPQRNFVSLDPPRTFGVSLHVSF